MASKGDGCSFSLDSGCCHVLAPLIGPFFFAFFLIRAGEGQPRPFFPVWCFDGVRLFKLRLKRPRELGDRAFLKTV